MPQSQKPPTAGTAGKSGTPRFEFPGGKRFAFTVLDDTDVATVENVAPVYRLFERLGLRTTKTVWPVGCPEGSPNFDTSETLEDRHYLDFVLDLRARGFEITWHGATMESSSRERTLRALARYRDVFGEYPKIHVNHSLNKENLYWGCERVDDPILKHLSARLFSTRPGYFQGHVEGSKYWWGDVAPRIVKYSRNLTCNGIVTSAFNPSMPYRDPNRPLAPWWFSCSDAEDVDEFIELIDPKNVDQLEAAGGFCIVATHLGKRFWLNGRVNPLFEERMTALAARDVWCPTVGELLDWLAERRTADTLPAAEWRAMQWRWAWDLVFRKVRYRMRAPQRRAALAGAASPASSPSQAAATHPPHVFLDAPSV
jgi:hypothetical protein